MEGGGPGVQLSSSSGFFQTGIAPKGWLGRPYADCGGA